MEPKPRRVLPLACQAASCPRDGQAVPRGTAFPRNAPTGCSWPGVADLFAPRCKKPASGNASHPLAQAKGLSGGEAVKRDRAARGALGGDRQRLGHLVEELLDEVAQVGRAVRIIAAGSVECVECERPLSCASLACLANRSRLLRW